MPKVVSFLYTVISAVINMLWRQLPKIHQKLLHHSIPTLNKPSTHKHCPVTDISNVSKFLREHFPPYTTKMTMYKVHVISVKATQCSKMSDVVVWSLYQGSNSWDATLIVIGMFTPSYPFQHHHHAHSLFRWPSARDPIFTINCFITFYWIFVRSLCFSLSLICWLSLF